MTDRGSKYDRAESYAAQKRYEEAITLYKELIAEHPGEDSLRLSLAWIYRDSGRIGEAIALFESLLEKELARNVFTGFAYDELVRVFIAQGDFERLVDICQKAVAVQPDDVGVLFTLGEAYLKSGLPRDAAAVFEKLIGMEPDSTVYFFSHGNALVASGDFDRAEEAYRQAMSLEPQEQDVAYHKLGSAYLGAGEYRRAESAFTRAIRFRGDRPLYYCSLGDAILKQGNVEEAQNAYCNAIRLDPEHRAAYYNRLGNALSRDGLNAEAVRIFRSAIAADPHNPFLYLHLAQACLAAGLDREAQEAYLKATSLEER
jgi:predicted Zn-dependent protease